MRRRVATASSRWRPARALCARAGPPAPRGGPSPRPQPPRGGGVPIERRFLAALRASRRTGVPQRDAQCDYRMREALRIFDEDIRETASRAAWVELLRGLVRHGDARRTVARLRQMEEATGPAPVETLNEVVALCARKGWISEVRRLVAVMRERGPRPDLRTYTALASAYAAKRELHSVMATVRQCEAEGFERDAVLWNVVMEALLRVGDARGVRREYEAMLLAGVQPTAATVSVLMRTHLQRNETADVVETFRLAQERGVEPNMRLYSTLVTAMCRAGRLGEALAGLDAMAAAGHPADGPLLFNVTGACAELGTREQFDALWASVRAAHGVEPNSNLYLARLLGLARHGDAEAAVATVAEMRARKQPVRAAVADLVISILQQHCQRPGVAAAAAAHAHRERHVEARAARREADAKREALRRVGQARAAGGAATAAGADEDDATPLQRSDEFLRWRPSSYFRKLASVRHSYFAEAPPLSRAAAKRFFGFLRANWEGFE